MWCADPERRLRFCPQLTVALSSTASPPLKKPVVGRLRGRCGSPSESVAGTQTPEMVVGDLDGLMKALGDDGPYLPIGQSADGMVASAYAVAHPDKVAGMVMVDARFDEEITLEDVGLVPN